MNAETLRNKRILVTGAGKGIGHAVVKQLHSLGSEVVALSKTQENLDKLKEEAPGIEIVCVDISDRKATENALQNVLPIDMVVNNAGISFLKTVLETTLEDIDHILSVNLLAAINISQIVCKDLIRRKAKGNIVNISSAASRRPYLDHLAYCTSKAALDMMTRCFAKEMGPHGIRVNSVNPTVVMTEMGIEIWSEPEKSRSMINQIPLGKFVSVEQVVDSVIFLLSDSSEMIHGQQLILDGGHLGC